MAKKRDEDIPEPGTPAYDALPGPGPVDVTVINSDPVNALPSVMTPGKAVAGAGIGSKMPGMNEAGAKFAGTEPQSALQFPGMRQVYGMDTSGGTAGYETSLDTEPSHVGPAGRQDYPAHTPGVGGGSLTTPAGAAPMHPAYEAGRLAGIEDTYMKQIASMGAAGRGGGGRGIWDVVDEIVRRVGGAENLQDRSASGSQQTSELVLPDTRDLPSGVYSSLKYQLPAGRAEEKLRAKFMGNIPHGMAKHASEQSREIGASELPDLVEGLTAEANKAEEINQRDRAEALRAIAGQIQQQIHSEGMVESAKERGGLTGRSYEEEFRLKNPYLSEEDIKRHTEATKKEGAAQGRSRDSDQPRTRPPADVMKRMKGAEYMAMMPGKQHPGQTVWVFRDKKTNKAIEVPVK